MVRAADVGRQHAREAQHGRGSRRQGDIARCDGVAATAGEAVSRDLVCGGGFVRRSGETMTKSRVAPFVLLLVLWPSTAWAASVTVSVASQDAAAGKDVAVPVKLRGASAIGALEFDLVY